MAQSIGLNYDLIQMHFPQPKKTGENFLISTKYLDLNRSVFTLNLFVTA
jgi:hypothetical protein